ncbi:putative indole-3-pyruvate monooxygenase YUCCA10 [Raphanus sativus]|uniref:indole-3-pyruvate monooxygenase n=1 Tax=Raphanus sativus TaxID=3726 RepID=A0A6J0P0D3_RAPSA|nr:probable indole-3-pyruvate monooxygenase YUCCA10 [Raphanus sativus]KAJ4896565.1 putative indole-3-pyruvate monooxygenase YUCCA10 [Raphanus sativus]
METVVLIVGAGPAGLATSVCLNQHSIPNIILEKEDIHASLWKKRAYERLKLHLAKNFCQLPYMPHGSDVPTFMSKDLFIEYLDAYVTRFDIKPRYNCAVKFSTFEVSNNKWRVEAENIVTGETEVYWSEFLVVATGENGDGNIPTVKGIDTFPGEIVHSSMYKSGRDFKGQNVLVVGGGNSGMEISFDLCNFDANTTVLVRTPRHILTKEEVYLGMSLLKYCPVKMVDTLVMAVSTARSFMYGDLSKYGLFRPKQGPFATKLFSGKAPVIDVGTVQKICDGKIQVINGGIRSIQEKTLTFENGKKQDFDVIVFATGYKSSVCNWLKNYEYMMKKDGFPKNPMPKHWKGENNLYCAGFSRKGIAGAAQDAVSVAEDIRSILATTIY